MTGPRTGSRVWALSRLEPGQSLLLEAPAGRVSAFMAQVQADMGRAAPRGEFTQALLLAIHPDTRRVFDVIRVTRKASDL